jgi:hypothetical protein
MQAFGHTHPKGKVLVADGSCVTPLAAARLGLCVMQYAPRPDRMSWVYVTNGISCGGAAKSAKPPKLELIMHWKPREGGGNPSNAVLQLAEHVLANLHSFGACEIISASEKMDLSSAGYQHWLACAPDPTLPEHIEAGGKVKLVMLLGISDAELQTAVKVKPEVADGRKVLLEALKIGGVFPVTDPGRTCLTRRRDFHRLWEQAFRTVREQSASS